MQLKQVFGKKTRAASSVSIIGGSDGPTSIFLAGKFSRQKKKHEKKMNQIISRIVPEPHSLDELAFYICDKYGAEKTSSTSRAFQDAYRNAKASLIMRNRPELIHTPEPEQPEKWVDENSRNEFFSQLDKRYTEAANIPDDIFQIQFVQYNIKLNDTLTGNITIDMVYDYGLMGTSLSCKGKNAYVHKILADIYRFYGVSQEDIDKRTDRLMTLVHIMDHHNL